MSKKIHFEVDDVTEKLKVLFEMWGADPIMSECDALICQTWKESTGDLFSERLQLWTSGYLFSQSLWIFIAKSQTWKVYASQKKLQVMDQISSLFEGSLMSETYEDTALSALESQNIKKIGILDLKTKNIKFSDLAHQKLNIECVDVTQFIKMTLNRRTTLDLKYAELGCNLAKLLMRAQAIHNIESIIDNAEEASHSAIAKRVQHCMNDSNVISKIEQLKVDPKDAQIAYFSVQSGTNFDFSPGKAANDNLLLQDRGYIVTVLTVKYREIYCNIVRTLVLNPTPEMKKSYNVAIDTMNQLCENVKVGRMLNEIYKAVDNYVRNKYPNMHPHMLPTFGHVMGIDFKYSSHVIREGTQYQLQPGTLLNLTVGFIDNSTNPATGIWIADTVQISLKPNGVIKTLTDGISKTFERISYSLEAETPKSGKESDEEISNTENSNPRDNLKNIILESRLRSKNSDSAIERNKEIRQREEIQAELRKKKVIDIRNRYNAGKITKTEGNDSSHAKLGHTWAYRSNADMPPEAFLGKVYVDMANEAIILPFQISETQKLPIPFHVSTIKNVTSTPDDSDSLILRINFIVPTTIQLNNLAGTSDDLFRPQCLLIKEILYHSRDVKHIHDTVRNCKNMIKQVKEFKPEEKGVTKDESTQKLILNPEPAAVLRDILVRPGLVGAKRTYGSLECHANGIRYKIMGKGGQEKVELLADNIKNAIFQPCEEELIVLLHFALNNPIILGKKKSSFVQFYVEVGNQVDDLTNKYNRIDVDEIEAENKERNLRKKLNSDFKNFVLIMENKLKIKFELPIIDLKFAGAVGKNRVDLIPTETSLVQMVELPPFILDLNTVEIVSFERIVPGVRNFDLVFILKDYSKPVSRVDLVAIEDLEMIKDWLTEAEIVYYEGTHNLHWPNILKTIRDDLDNFCLNNSFDEFMNEPQENEGNENDEGSSGEEDYTDETEEAESETESDAESELESLEAESNYEEEEEEEEEEDEGLSWDELEKEAIIHDRKRKQTLEEDSGRKRTKN